MKPFCLVIGILFCLPVLCQKADTLYPHILKVVKTQESASGLLQQLYAIKGINFIANNSFDRDIDFGVNHQRIITCGYSIDLLKRGDTIILRSVNIDTAEKSSNRMHEVYMTSLFLDYDKTAVAGYMKQRNEFYQSSKTVKDLALELRCKVTFAFYCGYGLPITPMGKKMKQFIAEKNFTAMETMLKSFNVEMQSFAVATLEMLGRRKGVSTSPLAAKLIRHIRLRNSEVLYCVECLDHKGQVFGSLNGCTVFYLME